MDKQLCTGRWKKRLKYSLLVLMILFACVVAISWQAGTQLLAPAHSAVGLPPADFPAETVKIPSESGSTLAGWFAAPESPKGVVVLLNGIRGTRTGMLERARWLHGIGYAVLLVDLQAHGESPGECITMGYLESRDAKAAVEFARSRSNGKPVALIGKSLGGAAALLGSPLGVDALVIESVYGTIEEAAANRMAIRLGFMGPPASQLLLCQLKPRLGICCADLHPIDRIAKVGCPILIMSGSDDLHTTLAETQRLFETAVEPKQLLIVEGATHQDLERVDSVKYREEVGEFLATFLNQPE